MLSQRRHGFHAVSFVWWHYFTHIFGVFVDVVYVDRIRIMAIGNFCRFCDVNYNHISVCCTAAAATHLYRFVVTSRRIEFFCYYLRNYLVWLIICLFVFYKIVENIYHVSTYLVQLSTCDL